MIILGIMIGVGISTNHPWFALFGGVAVVFWIVESLTSPDKVTFLFVNASALTTRTTSLFSKEIKIDAHGITFIGYSSGGEGDSSGLYASRGFFSSTCLIANLNSAEAESIALTIKEHFPDIGGSNHSAASTLFGEDPGMTSLGLSKSGSRTTSFTIKET